MPIRPDILVFSPDDKVQLAVEVKYRPGASEEWAARFRRNLLAHSLLPKAQYFLLVLPDVSYLWEDFEPRDGDKPRFRISTEELLRSFFDTVPADPSDEPGLELAVGAWLSSLTDPAVPREEIARRHRWLVESGVYDRIRGGHVEYLSAA